MCAGAHSIVIGCRKAQGALDGRAWHRDRDMGADCHDVFAVALTIECPFCPHLDPFADTGEDNLRAVDVKDESKKPKAAAQQQNYIHIRVQQRNGRKTLTTLQGLPKEYDQKKLLKAFKKEFACNGTLVDDEEAGQVIQLQGDQRQKISAFLCVF